MKQVQGLPDHHRAFRPFCAHAVYRTITLIATMPKTFRNFESKVEGPMYPGDMWYAHGQEPQPRKLMSAVRLAFGRMLAVTSLCPPLRFSEQQMIATTLPKEHHALLGGGLCSFGARSGVAVASPIVIA
eukprot:5479182-Amphidinium_carterae.3